MDRISLQLKLITILFQVMSESVAQDWSVSHTPSKLCVLYHSSVVLPCKYTYPSSQVVTNSSWHFRRSKGMEIDRRVGYSLSDGSNCSLTLRRVTQDDAGLYQFSFRTSKSTQDLTSEDGVTLEITFLQVAIEPMSDMVLEGDWVMLICGSCIPSLTVPTYTWYKDGHQYMQKHGDYQLELDNIQVEDEGSYQCSISGHEGLLSSAVNFTVIYPPKNISVSISSSDDIMEGSLVTLTCSSDAKPPVEIYKWFKGTEIVGNGKTYTISKISSEDRGEYKCKCSNKVGHQHSISVPLNVLYPPKNVSVSISSSGEIVEDSSVTLTCSSDANPPVENYTWFKEKESSPVGSGQSYRALQSGQYYCEAQNKHGSERSAAVSVPVYGSGSSVIVYVAVGVGLFGLAALLSAVFCLRSKRQKKQKEHHCQNAEPSTKDDTYAALDPAARTSDDVYHTLAITHPSPPADPNTSPVYENIAVGFSGK